MVVEIAAHPVSDSIYLGTRRTYANKTQSSASPRTRNWATTTRSARRSRSRSRRSRTARSAASRHGSSRGVDQRLSCIHHDLKKLHERRSTQRCVRCSRRGQAARRGDGATARFDARIGCDRADSKRACWLRDSCIWPPPVAGTDLSLVPRTASACRCPPPRQSRHSGSPRRLNLLSLPLT